MYRKLFGTKYQVQFDTAEDYYEFLGYLSKEDGTTKLVWEHNDEQGAWGEEGRIHFNKLQPKALNAKLSHTSGNGSTISRVNCNEFVNHIAEHHFFQPNGTQSKAKIRKTIPEEYLIDFDRGLTL